MPGTLICSNRSATANNRRPPADAVPRLGAPERQQPMGRIGTALASAGILFAGLALGFGPAAGPAVAKDLTDRSVPAQAPQVSGALQASGAPQVSQPAPASQSAPAGLVLSTADVTVDKGDTLAKLLAAQGVPPDNRRAVLAAISDIFDPASLQAGSRLRLTFAPATAANAGGNVTSGGAALGAHAGGAGTSSSGASAVPTRLVETVELMSGDTTSLTVHIDAARPVSDQDIAHALRGHSAGQLSKASIWTANRQPDAGAADQRQTASAVPEDDGQFTVRHVTGSVGKNLRTALLAEELPSPLADEIILGFKAGPGQRPTLHDTATFEVIYEGVQRDGKLDEPQLRYAMLDDGGKTRRIYRYQTDDQTTTLMQADGHGVALLDLGKPLQIDARITSPFGWRIHPVFGDRRFHEGVDFGAPTGTPVVAASDGVVEDIGWRGNYGKYIRLRRDGHLATAYAHLSGFARGLQRGSAVKRGDIIAYVGRSGVATGPHLYYEVLVDGKRIDPMKTPSVPVNLTGQQLAEFQRYVETTPEE